MRRGTGRLAPFVALAALAAASPAAAESPDTPVFNNPCSFSHRAPDDPIVAPGEPGAAHSHDFFGNFTTSAFSTHDGLRAAGTSCRRAQDTGAYWVPTLYEGERAIEPHIAQIYYRGRSHDRTAVRAHPPDLRVIAGRADATEPLDTRIMGWHCDHEADSRTRAEVPQCSPSQRLRLRIEFPDCWDGVRLDSPDHQSHMAYSRAGRCPEGHPVAVPGISLNVVYLSSGGSSVRLSSGHPRTAHADFLNAWDQEELERLVRVCINRTGNGDEPPCRASESRPPVDASLAPARAVFGAPVSLVGFVYANRDQSVTVQRQDPGGWTAVAELATARTGRFEHGFRAERSGLYRAVTPRGEASDPIRLSVEPQVRTLVRGARRRGRVLTGQDGTRLVRYRARRGDRVRLFAWPRPAKERVIVRVEHSRGGAYRQVRGVRRGRAAAAVPMRRPGRYRITVTTPPDSEHAAGSSAVRLVYVR